MSDYAQVTFIGGPLDMTRRALSIEEINRGSYRAYEQDTSSFTMDMVQRRGSMELKTTIRHYHIMPVGRDGRGHNVFVAVAQP